MSPGESLSVLSVSLSVSQRPGDRLAASEWPSANHGAAGRGGTNRKTLRANSKVWKAVRPVAPPWEQLSGGSLARAGVRRVRSSEREALNDPEPPE